MRLIQLLLLFLASYGFGQEISFSIDSEIIPDLISEPDVVYFTVKDANLDDFPKAITCEYSVQYVTEATPKQLSEYFADTDRYRDEVPNLLDFDQTIISEGITASVDEYQKTGVSVLGIHLGYEYILSVSEFYQYLPEKYYRTWTLKDSLDNGVEELDGLWYIEQFEYQRNQFTYVLFRTNVTFRKPYFGMPGLMKRFGPKEVKKLLEIICEKAQEENN